LKTVAFAGQQNEPLYTVIDANGANPSPVQTQTPAAVVALETKVYPLLQVHLLFVKLAV